MVERIAFLSNLAICRGRLPMAALLRPDDAVYRQALGHGDVLASR